MKRVLFITNVASPYRVCFFDELGKELDVTVVYADRAEEHRTREASWFGRGEGRFREVNLERRLTLGREANFCLDVVDWIKQSFDAIVLCGYSSPTFMLAIAYMSFKGIPFYLEVDGGLVRQESKPKYWLKRMLVGAADYWISSGKRTTDYLVYYGARAENTYLYPFTSLYQRDILPVAPTREEKLARRKALGITEKQVVLYVGRFDPLKGMDDLLEAACALDGGTGVYFVGGEPTQQHLDYCREHGLEGVHFVGFQSKEALSQWFVAADLLALPTKSDVWGLVVNEAMAHGLPVVTTDMCVAGLELVENGISGYIVPVDDVSALAEKIRAVLAEGADHMGTAALEKIRPYTYENMARAHVEIFD